MATNILAAAFVLLGAGCVQSQSRIVNGQEAEEGEFPFIVALYELANGKFKFICGGSILDERHILTAAHCMSSPNIRVVNVGCHRRTDCSGSELTIEQFITHPNNLNNSDDLAIIRTNEVIEFTSDKGLGSVDKVHFPDSAEDDYVDWESLTVAGWGFRASTAYEAEDVLMKTSVKAIPLAQCTRASVNNICARDPETNACRGDSGGPLIRYLSDGTMSLVGVVQGSAAEEETPDVCNPKHGTLYMRVAVYAKWIRDCMAAITFKSRQCSSPGYRAAL